MTRSENMELVEVLERLLDRVAALDAAIASLSAPRPPAEAIELTVCCGREECGGECGNEWRGMEWVRKAGTPPAEARECPHRTRCDCLASCKHGMAGDGAAPAEAQAQGGGEVLGYVRLAAIVALQTDDEVTGVMVHSDPPTDSVPVYLKPPSAPVGVEVVDRVAAALLEEATDEPWTVAGVEHEGPDRDYYRKLSRKVLTLAAQQPAACPRCDGTGEADSGGIHPWGAPAMIRCECQQPAAVGEVMVSRFLEAFRNTDGDEAIDADEKVAHRWLTAALAAQQGGVE